MVQSHSANRMVFRRLQNAAKESAFCSSESGVQRVFLKWERDARAAGWSHLIYC